MYGNHGSPSVAAGGALALTGYDTSTPLLLASFVLLALLMLARAHRVSVRQF